MKCKYCGALIPVTPRRGRCPDCGASLMEKTQGMTEQFSGVAERRPRREINWYALIFAGGFLVAGLLLTLAGLTDGYDYYKNKDYLVTVDAQIMQIRKVTTYDRVHDEYDTDITVFVCYTYDGEDYTGVELNFHTSTMEEGDIYQVEIDRRNPGQIVSNELWLAAPGLVMLAVGGLVFWALQPRQKPSANPRVA